MLVFAVKANKPTLHLKFAETLYAMSQSLSSIRSRTGKCCQSSRINSTPLHHMNTL